ncbi:uncharacterized protein LOC107730409 [Sinocyclocheilus rhinocerous]|uniref:uncharacterized protein LOC107730409 n=1 Tax=Sinocyclocheilus rhinocerous TaxID=307959 RepID=UPI0007B9F9BB|nr:PREDICTED: uncharacterized protein LOC107730409 [Sinocyclocheilus rhinocerous]
MYMTDKRTTRGVSGVDTDRVSVSVMEGDSVTLNTGVKTNQQDDIKWYFSGFLVAHISGDQSKNCTDVQCNEGTERFRDRLKLDHQTGSLTITNTRTTDSGDYKLQIFSSSDSETIFNVTFYSVSAAERDEIKSVKEGESVTLDPGVIKRPNDVRTWHFNDILLAEITGDQSEICTDELCDEIFRDRLKLDHQTAVFNKSTEGKSKYREQQQHIKLRRVSGVDTDRVSVSVMEGDSVTLNTGVKTNQQDDIKWYFSGFLVAHISGDQSKNCTDVQCNEGTERFRDRLKLDHQTGSLTITNTRTTDSGDYKLQIFSSSDSETIFNVTFYSVSAAERDEIKSVKEGESVTLDPGVIKRPNDVRTWHFNDILLAEITGDQSEICTDELCDEIFRDRLKLDHQTGSLTITNTRTTDSGDYELRIIISSSSFSFKRIKSFSFTVTGSGLSPGKIAGICAAVVVLLMAVTVSVFCCHRHRSHTAVSQNISITYS